MNRFRFLLQAILTQVILACCLSPGLSIAKTGSATSGLTSLVPYSVAVTDIKGTYAMDPSSALPYLWDSKHVTEGSVVFEFRFNAMDIGTSERLGIYFPKIGATYKIWLNEELIEDLDTGKRHKANYGNVARMLELPKLPILVDGEVHIIKIEIHAQIWGVSGLSALYIGPLDVVRKEWTANYNGDRFPAIGVGVLSGMLGLFGWLLWWHMRETMYFAYALAETLWSWRTFAVYVVDETWLPWPLWSLLILSAYMVAVIGICIFALALIDRLRPPWITAIEVYALFSLGVILVTYFSPEFAAVLRRPWRVATFSLSAGLGLLIFRVAWQTRAREAIVLSACVALILLVSARDLVIVTLLLSSQTSSSWLVYAWPLFGLTVAWLLAERLRESTKAQLSHATDLRRRLQDQELQLNQAHNTQQALVVKHVAGEERKRVLQDMHDGVGHELLGALQMARSVDGDVDALTLQIQRALDHLKLSVDVLQEGAEDISTMLGLLRYRLSSRFAAHHIELIWSVDPLPHPDGWDTRKTRELQLLLYEAFSNLIQHSKASRAHFSARISAGKSIFIDLVDDGVGMHCSPDGTDATAGSGYGLQSMQARALRLHAQLRLTSPGTAPFTGLRQQLTIPLG